MKRFLGVLLLVVAGVSANSQVLDGSFEAGTTGGFWDDNSTNFGGVICSFGICGDYGGEALPYTGGFWVWMGGLEYEPGYSLPEEGFLEQEITIPSGAEARLEMRIDMIPGSMGTKDESDYVNFVMDADTLLKITPLDSATYLDYPLVTIDVSSYSDGGLHDFLVYGIQTSEDHFSVLIDDIVLYIDDELVNLFEPEKERTHKLYPNPASDEVTFEVDQLDGHTLSIYNNLGQVVYLEKLTDTQTSIAVSDWSRGVYTYHLTSEGKLEQGKLSIVD